MLFVILFKIYNYTLKADIRHCMPHLYIHVTLYSMHRLVVPFWKWELQDPISLWSVSSISCVNCTHISRAGILYSVTSNRSLLSVSSISCVNCTDICRAGILYSITSDISLNLFPPTIEGFGWTKPGIWKWTNKDLRFVCLTQQQP